MPHRRMLAAAAALSLITAGLAAPVVAQDEETPPAPPQATPNPEPMEVPSGDGTAVRLTTDLGDVVIGLFNESAPVAAENFLNLADSGFYDGIGFHRVVPGFVVQGGDPEGTGGGGPGYTIEDEEVVGQYGRGIVAMARTQAPNSQGSQFFFVLDDSAEAPLESARTYVIFGRVIEGMDVVDAIVEAREPSDLIEDPVRIISASVEQVELPPEPSPAPPSEAEVAAAELQAMLPVEIAGLPLQSTAFTSDEILPGSGEDAAVLELTSISEANDASIAELAIATAGSDDGSGTFVTVLAGSIPGVPADLVAEPMRQLIIGDTEGAEISDMVIAGRDVKQVQDTQDAGPENTIYVIESDDVVWFVVADPDSLEEAIAALP
jgi:peptidyl-prolyl cis-trans isomerase B (cyclophilin B)